MCREFGISRKTGYKIYERYKNLGEVALSDRSRRPGCFGNKLPQQVESAILELKKKRPYWGARKLRELLAPKLGPGVSLPAVSTIHMVLDRHGLVQPMSARRNRAQGTSLFEGENPNDLWCVDFKGQFQLGNKRYCYPLTVSDYASRYLLLCESLESTCEQTALSAFDRLFKERGLPYAIRSDNGVPFASPNALFHLSTLSVWWLRLGIRIERIKPGRPQQNGRHERMHLTLKREATRPARANSLQQQAAFDEFVREFNEERPHEALAMRKPAEVYTRSTQTYRDLPELEYPFHDRTVTVMDCGRISLHRRQVNISAALRGQTLGLREVEDEVWLVSFMDFDLGYIDLEKRSLQALEDPFRSGKV